GGPVIDKLAPHGNPDAVKFQMSQMKHRDRNASRERSTDECPPDTHPRFDFSYSGIKTAVLRYVETHDLRAAIEARRQALAKLQTPELNDYLRFCDRQTLDLVASFQRAMVSDLVAKTLAAAREYEVQSLFVSGGVAANQELRAAFERDAAMEGMLVFFPSRSLSTDNAPMIAPPAYPKFVAGEFVAADFSAEAGMSLGGVAKKLRTIDEVPDG